jgi:signal transduction histidine kinase
MLERKSVGQSSPARRTRKSVVSVVQEIRQPMSSIMGYTDLLLAESVGILGALQRKFLERIKGSTVRMHTMLNELIQVARWVAARPSSAWLRST